MKTAEEIQFAHDVLEAIQRGEVEIAMTPAKREAIAKCQGVLCWILEDPAQGVFAGAFRSLLREIENAGYRMQRLPIAMTDRPGEG